MPSAAVGKMFRFEPTSYYALKDVIECFVFVCDTVCTIFGWRLKSGMRATLSPAITIVNEYCALFIPTFSYLERDEYQDVYYQVNLQSVNISSSVGDTRWWEEKGLFWYELAGVWCLVFITVSKSPARKESCGYLLSAFPFPTDLTIDSSSLRHKGI